MASSGLRKERNREPTPEEPTIIDTDTAFTERLQELPSDIERHAREHGAQ